MISQKLQIRRDVSREFGMRRISPEGNDEDGAITSSKEVGSAG